MSARERFLDRVRQAVAEGNRAGGAPPLPERGNVGYQGAGPDPVARLREQFTAAGGVFHEVTSSEEALNRLREVLRQKQVQRVLVGDGGILDSLDLERALAGVEVQRIRELAPQDERKGFFSADAGISGVDYLLAETGTLVLSTRRDQPRSLSLLPPLHIALAREQEIEPDLFDVFAKLGELPGCLTLITGPSKTGDIELKLVTGVHGPGEVHLVLIRSSA